MLYEIKKTEPQKKTQSFSEIYYSLLFLINYDCIISQNKYNATYIFILGTFLIAFTKLV